MQSPRASVCRIGSLIALGIIALHQLRYALAFGSRSGEELAKQGHGYLLDALPVITGMALAVLAAGVIRALWTGRTYRVAALGGKWRWLLYAAAILVVYASQELLEGTLSAGHPAGAAAVIGASGWLAIPLAAILGALIAQLDGFVVDLEIAAATSLRSILQRAPKQLAAVAGPQPQQATPSPLAFGLARRPPPSPAR